MRCAPARVSHLILCLGVRLLGEGEGVGQAGHLVVTGGDVGGVAGLRRGVTGARCVMGQSQDILIYILGWVTFVIQCINRKKGVLRQASMTHLTLVGVGEDSADSS